MKIGDVSRQRRFADPARQTWHARHRAVRFAFHVTGRRPEQVSFPEPMSRIQSDSTHFRYDVLSKPVGYCRRIVGLYRRPNMMVEQICAAFEANEFDPLREFSAACRMEWQCLRSCNSFFLLLGSPA